MNPNLVDKARVTDPLEFETHKRIHGHIIIEEYRTNLTILLDKVSGCGLFRHESGVQGGFTGIADGGPLQIHVIISLMYFK